MYKILLEAHSGIAYLTLLGLLISTIYYFIKSSSKQSLITKNKTISLVTMIVVHLQALLGLILFFVSPKGKQLFNDFGAAMQNDALRKQIIEHPVTMILVAVLVTIANKKIKQASLQGIPLKMVAPVLYLIALALALAMVPWGVWL